MGSAGFGRITTDGLRREQRQRDALFSTNRGGGFEPVPVLSNCCTPVLKLPARLLVVATAFAERAEVACVRSGNRRSRRGRCDCRAQRQLCDQAAADPAGPQVALEAVPHLSI